MRTRVTASLPKLVLGLLSRVSAVINRSDIVHATTITATSQRELSRLRMAKSVGNTAYRAASTDSD